MGTYSWTTPEPCDCCGTCTGCSSCKLGVLVYNCNGITDDNFKLYLNGTAIATIPERMPDPVNCNVPPEGPPQNFCRWQLVHAPGSSGTINPHGYDCGCIPPDSPSSSTAAALDVTTADGCQLSFTLESLNDNNCANFGVFNVYRWCGKRWCIWYESVYNMASLGVNTYTVPNPCCHWYCYNASGDPVNAECTEFPTDPPTSGFAIGPYATSADCPSDCGKAWYCVSPAGSGADPTCVQFTDPPDPSVWDIYAGGYYTSFECNQACGGGSLGMVEEAEPLGMVAPTEAGNRKLRVEKLNKITPRKANKPGGCGCKGGNREAIRRTLPKPPRMPKPKRMGQ